MFILNEIFNSNQILLIFFVILFLILSWYILGETFHKFFKFERTNIPFIISTGIILYFLITFIYYLPFIILNVNFSILVIVEKFKEISLFVLLIFYIMQIFKLNNKFLIKKTFSALIFILVIFFSIAAFYLCQNSFNAFNTIDKDNPIILSLKSIAKNDYSLSNFSPYDTNVKNEYAIFQTYYWFSMSISLILNIDIMNVFLFLMPFIFLFFFACITFGTFYKKDSEISILHCLIIFVFLFMLVGLLSTINNWTFTIIILVYYIFSLYKVEHNFRFNNKYLLLPCFSFLLIFSSNYYVIFLSLAFSISTILFLINKSENIGKTFNQVFTIILLETFLITYIINIILFIILFIFLGSIWLFTITGYYRKREMEEIINVENWIKNNEKKIMKWLLIVLYSLFFIMFIRDMNYLLNIYASIFVFKSIFQIFVYIIFCNVIPILLLINFIFKKVNIKSYFYISMFLYVIFFNPLIIAMWTEIFNIEMLKFGLILNIFFVLLFMFDISESYYEKRRI